MDNKEEIPEPLFIDNRKTYKWMKDWDVLIEKCEDGETIGITLETLRCETRRFTKDELIEIRKEQEGNQFDDNTPIDWLSCDGLDGELWCKGEGYSLMDDEHLHMDVEWKVESSPIS